MSIHLSTAKKKKVRFGATPKPARLEACAPQNANCAGAAYAKAPASQGDAYGTSLRLSGFLEQFAKPASGRGAVELTRRHVENELFPIVDRQFPVR